jgi:hypothetical protein
MARPPAAPAPRPDDDDDLVIPADAPRPIRAGTGHPVGPSGTLPPRRQGALRERAQAVHGEDHQGDKVPERQSGKVLVRQGGSTPGNQGDQVPRSQDTLESSNDQGDAYAGRQKLGARISRDLKRRLKIAAAVYDRTEESIVVEAIEHWLDQHPSTG